jgi:putative heme transporter
VPDQRASAQGRKKAPGARRRPLTWKLLLRQAIAVGIGGLVIYLLLPKLTRLLASWPRLAGLAPAWIVLALAAEVASFVCYFGLQRLALRTTAWFAVVTAGLTGNAVSGILPGGSAAGATLQFEMLSAAGLDPDSTVSGLAAISLINVAALLALPLLALPAMLAGIAVSPGLLHAGLVGIAGFVLLAAAGAIILHTDWPLRGLARAVQSLHNHVFARHRQPVSGLDKRFLADRDSIRDVLGRQWRQALLLTTGRIGFDFGCLLCALRATGAHPQPSLALLAYAAADIVALIPLTPGGLGIVEASLAGLLVLAGVPSSAAFVATLAYRLISYWLPVLAGGPAYLTFRHRYGAAWRRPSQHQTDKLAISACRLP